MSTTRDVCEIVRDAEDNLVRGTTTIGKYVTLNFHDIIETINAYLNSKHISGDTDSLGRPKPFFNIVTAATNIWYRATDIDRKDIRVMPGTLDQVGMAFIAGVLLQDWMKKARFGVFLNDWGRALAKYGSAVVKFVEKGGELTASVVPWDRFIFDPVDFDAIPHIEKFYKTEEQLYRMVKENGYDKVAVEKLCESIATRKTLEGTEKDNQSNFIELYEVHGVMSKATYLKSKGKDYKDEDDDEYFQQMHVVSFVQHKDGYDNFTLYSGKEKKDPYMLTHLIKEDGRTLSIGAVEYLFDAQWMQNHTVKNMKDTLDIASKLVFQTADSRYVGRNVLSAIETGDIFIHKENMPLTRVANDKPDISAQQNFGNMWQFLGKELTSTPDAARGNNPPSGQPLGATQIVTNQGMSLFEIMTENKGLYIEDMLRDFIIPHLKLKMDNKDEVVAILDSESITELDTMFIPAEAARLFNERAVKQAIKYLQTDNPDDIPSPYQPDVAQTEIKQGLASLGNKRSFKPDDLDTKTWKDALRDFEWRVEVQVTNENKDKATTLASLSSAFQTVASLAGRPMTSDERMVFNRILQESGTISPVQLSVSSATPTASPPQALPANQ